MDNYVNYVHTSHVSPYNSVLIDLTKSVCLN
jgi:hypothetical protein